MAIKQHIVISDFDLFVEVLKSTAKIVESAKFLVEPDGFYIYGARSKIARCEISSNSIKSENSLAFSVENMQMFLRIVQSVKDIHDGDYSRLKFFLDGSFLRFESNKIKTKYATCNENIITAWISKKMEATFTPVFEFTTTSDLIKRINGHTFMFSDPKSVRVYLETKPDMENNAVFATIGNRETDLNNELTLKFGIVNAGSLIERDEKGLVKNDRSIIVDLERLNLFNAVQSNNIKIRLMNVNCLDCCTTIPGKDGTYFKLVIYSTILKN